MKYLKTFENIKGKSFKDLLKKNPEWKTATKIIALFNDLTDLEGIQDLTNLKHFNCGGNKLEELSNIDKLTNLQSIACGKNPLKRLPNLDKLTNLEFIYCNDCELEEFPDLDNLTKLIQIYCWGNKLPYKDLDGYWKWYYDTKYPERKEAKKFGL